MRSPAAPAAPQLLGDIRQLIEQSRQQLATAVNSALTLLVLANWPAHPQRSAQGRARRLRRADCLRTGETIGADYGRGFSAKNLRHMLRFAEAFPDQNIVSAVRRQLSWTHIKTLIYIEDPLKRDFYLQMCQQERWSARSLQERLDSLLFERTALSRQPEQLLEQRAGHAARTISR
jgi:hypothetical protein